MPSMPTATTTVTLLSTLSLALENTDTVFPKHNNLPQTKSATITAHHGTATTRTAAAHHQNENVTTVTPTAGSADGEGNGGESPPPTHSGAPGLPPMITIAPQGPVAVLSTLSPKDATSAPSTDAAHQVVQLQNTFKINTWVLDNSVTIMFSMMSVMVSAVSAAWYWSHRLRRRPPRVDMFVEPIEPRAVWPEPYRYGRALLTLFPNPQSPFVPPRNHRIHPQRTRVDGDDCNSAVSTNPSAAEDLPTDNSSLVNMLSEQ
eukprot:PhM_4_TR15998/c0_g1_i2/m.93909